MKKGVSLNWVVDTATAVDILALTDIAPLRQAGAKLARIDLRLGQETSWTPALLAAYGQAIGALVDAGLDVVGLLGPGIVPAATQAAWNQGNTENGGDGWNPYLDHYLRAVRTLVSAFPQIGTWEVWNEPNAWSSHTGTVYGGSSYIYPSLYAALLGHVYPLIKSIQPASPVCTGGLFAHDIGGVLSRDNSGASYLDTIYDNLYWLGTDPLPFDVIGLHLYIDQGGALVQEHLQRYLDMILEVISWYEHDPVRPVYVTEAGWTTTSVSVDVQASNLAALYNILSLNQYVQAGLWFQIRDNPGGSQYYGLCHADGTPKPAFAAFSAV